MQATKLQAWPSDMKEVPEDIIMGIPGYDPYRDAEGYTFDHDLAISRIRFIEIGLCHTKGGLAGKPLILADWERSIVVNLFGWIAPRSGFRRYREAFIYVPRKNGKTTLMAAVACVLFYTDGEPGAEIYTCAAEKDQASILWGLARSMIAFNKDLEEITKVYKGFKCLEIGDRTKSIMRPVSADSDTKHGYNVHAYLADELHAHKNSSLYDAMQTGTGIRDQPLGVGISTADIDRHSLCNTKLEYAEQVQTGVVPDSAFLPVIYRADKEDDWKDPEVWAKANPNLGISISMNYMERECRKAQDSPVYENTFKRFHLNIVTEQADRWISIDQWDACNKEIDKAALQGMPCHMGLDLSTTTDLTALVAYFPHNHAVLPWFWVPKDNANDREKKDRVPYLTWERQGFLMMTPGNRVDYDYIIKHILEMNEKYDVLSIAYDPWNATGTALTLKEQHGLNMIEFRQGWVTMNEPCKELERLIGLCELRHGAHPVLRWNAANVAVKMDASDNIRIDKEKSSERVDGMVALAMAIGRAKVTMEEIESPYTGDHEVMRF